MKGDVEMARTEEQIRRRQRQLRLWRNIWGVLVLLSLGWVCYGFSASGQAYTNTVEGSTSTAYQGGAAIGAGLGITFFICSALPFLLLFGFLYMRAGSNLRSEIQHEETLRTMRGDQE